jgi:hypothetical protein
MVTDRYNDYNTQVLLSLPDFHAAKRALHRAYKLNTPIESDRKTIEKNLKLGKNILMLSIVRNVEENGFYICRINGIG